jgi:hypothetical protein
MNVVLLQSTFATWMALVSVALTLFLIQHTNTLTSGYFRFGPHDAFIVFGMPVNTATKYVLITLYSFINAGIRALHHNLLQPWILHNVQVTEPVAEPVSIPLAYRMTALATCYQWFDWFIYMNILLSQVDMLIIELTADLLTTVVTTHLYLRKQTTPQKLTLLPPNFITSSPSNTIGIHCGR